MMISAKGICKTYGQTQVLHDIDMDLAQGEILGLIGQNGSGKSTLLKILSGAVQPTMGKIMLRGEPCLLRSALHATELGIAMVHQEQSLIGNLTVAENIFLNKRHPARRHGLYNWSGLNRAAATQLGKLDSEIPPTVIVDRLSFSDRQTVEFAKALAIEELVGHPLIILMDEPTALLTPNEIDQLFAQMRRLRSRASFVFVSHRMDEVLSISDRVCVLSNGRKVAERRPDEADHDSLYHLMVGTEKAADFYGEGERVALANAPVRLQVERMRSDGKFAEIDLAVRAGEIMAFTGVAGSGASELLRAIFGIENAVTGRLSIDGKSFAGFPGPKAAIRAGLGYLAAERKAEGIVLRRSVLENTVLTFGPRRRRRGRIDLRRERADAARLLAALKVKAVSTSVLIDRLSGGNQQKVALAKWLMNEDLKVLLLDHPSRGLDPGAKADLFTMVRELARRGLSVLFVSDTIEETLGMSDTIVVMRDGAVSKRFDNLARRKPSAAEIVEAMV